ncbi:MAG: amidohydrolase [Bergeyella sp.]
MKISGLNQNIHWKDKRLNFITIEEEFKNTEADIFLLPEMFSTGFCMEAEEIADRNQESLSWMKSFAKKKNSAVAGSVSVAENGKFHNRFYFVKPDGSFEFYDKRHLFSYSGEEKIYTPGTERKITEYKGIRFLMQVCYDLRFPVFSRNNEDYDVALYVANWPETRVEAWKHLLKARAIENQSYVFGLNRIGTDGNNLNYEESSLCFFADGTEISEHSGNIVNAEIDLEKLKEFRGKFPFLKDRDDFELNF